ncbi:beta-galactosidase [bacterium A37T11]|nr:beta-galactosidase [bacterium A37T11]
MFTSSFISAKVKWITYVYLLLITGWSNVYGQTARQMISFNDHWQFRKGAYDKRIDTLSNGWEEVSIPHTFNREDMQLGKNFYTGGAIYRKSFFVDSALKGKRLFLRFEGVGSVAKLYVNEQYLGDHRGAYAAFTYEITHSVKFGQENTILVQVNNEARKDIIPVNNFLFPVYGGIYRPVSFIITGPINFTATDYGSSGVSIRQNKVSDTGATIQINAKLENKTPGRQAIQLQTDIRDQQGKLVMTEKTPVLLSPQGFTLAEQRISLKNPHLWNGVKDPYLYRMTLSLKQGDSTLDEQVQPLGLRYYEIIPGKGLFLNGARYPMHGVTRHQDRWGYGSALSHSQHLEDMQLIKEMGATTIRLAHYQQAEDMYALADSMGFLIWAEIPFVNSTSFEESDNAKQQLTELIRQNRNHPSIYIWGMHNEVYSKTADGHVPVLTRQLADLAKTEDPDRLTGSVNGYGTMNRPENLNADVQGMNRYYGWYEGQIGDMKGWAEKLQKDYPDYKLMLMEYGADGNIDQSSEELPTERDPVDGQFFPENYQTETHIQQWAIIESHPYITASYLWNMFEFATPMWDRGGVKARNLKGLITIDRKRKKDAYYWYKANWNPAPMIYLANRRDNLRKKRQTSVQVFSNLTGIKLWVNGKSYTSTPGVNSKHFIFKNVPLRKGTNHIQAKATLNGKEYTDEMEWKYIN